MIFDATSYSQKPITVMQPFTLVTSNECTRGDLSKVTDDLTCLDVEGMSFDLIVALLARFRLEYPGVRCGLYGFLPQTTYWRVQRVLPNYEKEHRDWSEINQAQTGLSHLVDVVFPSLYTQYPDQNGWARYAVENIIEAKRYNKPVYPFLWPQYHDSSELKLQYIPQDYFKMQIRLCEALCDGVVIWGGWDFTNDKQTAWDNPAWYDTMERLK